MSFVIDAYTIIVLVCIIIFYILFNIVCKWNRCFSNALPEWPIFLCQPSYVRPAKRINQNTPTTGSFRYVGRLLPLTAPKAVCMYIFLGYLFGLLVEILVFRVRLLCPLFWFVFKFIKLIVLEVRLMFFSILWRCFKLLAIIIFILIVIFSRLLYV